MTEINALNAIFAVMKCKKLYGFLNDLVNKYYCSYSINVDHIENDHSST